MILSFYIAAVVLAKYVKLDYFSDPAYQLTIIDGSLSSFIADENNQESEEVLVETEQFKCIKISKPNEFIRDENSLDGVKAKAIQIIKQLPCLEYVFDKTWVYKFCNGEITQEFSSFIKVQFKNDPVNLKTVMKSRYVLGVVDGFNDEELKSKPDGSQYLKKYLIDGDFCSSIGTNRAVLVNYLCGIKGGDYISSVVEFSVCMYRVIVRTKRLCQLPSFNPPEVAIPGTIQCIKKNGISGTVHRIIGPDLSFIDYSR